MNIKHIDTLMYNEKNYYIERKHKKIIEVFWLTILIFMASVSSINAGGGYCYPCLMETDGKDYCRYYEYKSVYRETEPSIVTQIKACEPRGYTDSLVGGGRGVWSYGGSRWTNVEDQAECLRLLTYKAKNFPPYDANTRCFRTYINGELYAKSSHDFSPLRPRGNAWGVSQRTAHDYVGESTKFEGNGVADALFNAQLTAYNRTITYIKVENINGQHSVWDTSMTNGYWLGVIRSGGHVISRDDGSVSHKLAGNGTADIQFFVEDNGAIQGGKTDFRMTVFLDNGEKVIIPFLRTSRYGNSDIKAKNAEELLKHAKKLWGKGNLLEAIDIAQRASKKVPDNIKVVKTLRAMKNQKKIMDNYLSESENLIKDKEFKKSKSTLEKAERISSNYPPYVKMLDKLRKAKEKFDQIKKIIKEAKQEGKRKKQQSAISKLDKVLTIDPMHKEAARLKKEWEKILRDQEKASKPNWNNGCYNGKNSGGAVLQWTLRDPPPYSGLTPICSDRDGKLWILNNHISKIVKGKLNRYGCYSGSTVKVKKRDYSGTLCRPKGYNENTKDKPERPNKVNGALWDVWGPIPYGYGKKCLTETEVTQQMKPGSRPNKNGWYTSKNGGTMKPTGKSCTKPRSRVGPSSGYVVVRNVVGLSKKQAEKKLKEIGLKTKITLGDPAPSKKNGLKVQKSIPATGKTIKRGSTVTLVVHPPFVDRRTVPSLTSETENEVIKKIKNAGLIPRIRKVTATSASQSGKISLVKPLSGSKIIAGSTVYVDIFEDFGVGSDSDQWVDKVVSFIRPPGSSDEGFGSDSALGAPTTAKFVAIDKPETIIFAFTDNVLVDGEGNDLKLHEYVNGDSPVEVFVSADNTRYISLGKTAKSAEYDLANYGLSTVTYVKLVGLADGGAAKGYDLMAIEALNSTADKITIFVDTFEDFGGKSTNNESKCTKYNECLTEMMHEIQQLSLNMASGQSMSFGCKYFGLGQAFAKVAQDANSAGCTIDGNYAHTGEMIKRTAAKMCAVQAVYYDTNKIPACRKLDE